MAAQTGDATAAYLLGMFYKDGELFKKNIPQAVKWLTISMALAEADDPKLFQKAYAQLMTIIMLTIKSILIYG